MSRPQMYHIHFCFDFDYTHGERLVVLGQSQETECRGSAQAAKGLECQGIGGIAWPICFVWSCVVLDCLCSRCTRWAYQIEFLQRAFEVLYSHKDSQSSSAGNLRDARPENLIPGERVNRTRFVGTDWNTKSWCDLCLHVKWSVLAVS